MRADKRRYTLGAGEVIDGRYMVVRPLGRGWEGQVFEAREVGTGAVRAVKILRPDEEQTPEAIIRTAATWERLSQTGAVSRYYGVGQFTHRQTFYFYLITELLRGVRLDRWLRGAQQAVTFDQRAALKVVLAVAERLASVHRTGRALGDFSHGTNTIVLNAAGTDVRFCDFEPGCRGKPYRNYKDDLRELEQLADLAFRHRKRNGLYREAKKTFRRCLRRRSGPGVMAELARGLKGLLGEGGR